MWSPQNTRIMSENFGSTMQINMSEKKQRLITSRRKPQIRDGTRLFHLFAHILFHIPFHIPFHKKITCLSHYHTNVFSRWDVILSQNRFFSLNGDFFHSAGIFLTPLKELSHAYTYSQNARANVVLRIVARLKRAGQRCASRLRGRTRFR